VSVQQSVIDAVRVRIVYVVRFPSPVLLICSKIAGKAGVFYSIANRTPAACGGIAYRPELRQHLQLMQNVPPDFVHSPWSGYSFSCRRQSFRKVS